MAERQRGRDPNQKRGSEHAESDHARYVRAACYPNEHMSEAPYDALRELIYQQPCNMSVYRQLLLQADRYDATWLVIAAGIAPPAELQTAIEHVLATGEAFTLDETVVQALFERRERANEQGQWVERRNLQLRKRRLS
jgi:hypothetical protein